MEARDDADFREISINQYDRNMLHFSVCLAPITTADIFAKRNAQCHITCRILKKS